MIRNWSLPQLGIALAGFVVGTLTQKRRAIPRNARVPQRAPWGNDFEQLERRISCRQTTSDASFEELRQWLTGSVETWESRLTALEQATPWMCAIEESGKKFSTRWKAQESVIASQSIAIQEVESRLDARLKRHESSIARHLADQDHRVDRLLGQVEEIATAQVTAPAAPVDLDAQIGRIQNLEMRVADHERRLDQSAALVSALEKAIGPGMLQLEERLQAQTLSLTMLSADTRQTAEELKRVVETIESEARLSARQSDTLAVSAGPIGPLSSLIDEDAALARMFHVHM